eukprot:scaffold115_cov304-Prasinococcus_capsulatus_cf.AAC.44
MRSALAVLRTCACVVRGAACSQTVQRTLPRCELYDSRVSNWGSLYLRSLCDAASPKHSAHSSEEQATIQTELPSDGDASLVEQEGDPLSAGNVAGNPMDIPLPTYLFQHSARKREMDLAVALESVRTSARAKFDETVEVAVNLGIDPKRSDQIVRGVVSMPHGTGKKVRIAVFASGDDAEAARAAGADTVGAEDLVERIKQSGGKLDFDRTLAHPSTMPLVSQVARILGPKGLMPNPKLGTVTTDLVGAVGAARKGQVQFRAEKGGIVHAPVGKLSMSNKELLENMAALREALIAARPKLVSPQLSTKLGRATERVRVYS